MKLLECEELDKIFDTFPELKFLPEIEAEPALAQFLSAAIK
jgi:hypothetical protein